jgi:hypothetical protein
VVWQGSAGAARIGRLADILLDKRCTQVSGLSLVDHLGVVWMSGALSCSGASAGSTSGGWPVLLVPKWSSEWMCYWARVGQVAMQGTFPNSCGPHGRHRAGQALHTGEACGGDVKAGLSMDHGSYVKDGCAPSPHCWTRRDPASPPGISVNVSLRAKCWVNGFFGCCMCQSRPDPATYI